MSNWLATAGLSRILGKTSEVSKTSEVLWLRISDTPDGGYGGARGQVYILKAMGSSDIMGQE
jgi:hypothetical protein